MQSLAKTNAHRLQVDGRGRCLVRVVRKEGTRVNPERGLATEKLAAGDLKVQPSGSIRADFCLHRKRCFIRQNQRLDQGQIFDGKWDRTEDFNACRKCHFKVSSPRKHHRAPQLVIANPGRKLTL